MRVLLIGPPGAGKGTQAGRIAAHFDLTRIATGDLLRHEVASGSALGRTAKAYIDRGDLVPDDVVITMTRDRVVQANTEGGYRLVAGCPGLQAGGERRRVAGSAARCRRGARPAGHRRPTRRSTTRTTAAPPASSVGPGRGKRTCTVPPLNSTNSQPKSRQTARMIAPIRSRCVSVNTGCRYFVTKTKWACSAKRNADLYERLRLVA
jgi:Adenylate kinase